MTQRERDLLKQVHTLEIIYDLALELKSLPPDVWTDFLQAVETATERAKAQLEAAATEGV